MHLSAPWAEDRRAYIIRRDHGLLGRAVKNLSGAVTLFLAAWDDFQLNRPLRDASRRPGPKTIRNRQSRQGVWAMRGRKQINLTRCQNAGEQSNCNALGPIFL